MQPYLITPQDAPLKRCKKCEEVKPATAEYFFRKKGGKHGLCATCKKCDGIYRSAYRAKHREAMGEYGRRYYAANREARAEYARKHGPTVREARRKYQREYYAKNPEAGAEYARKWRAANRASYIEYKRRWKTANRDAQAEYKNRRRANAARAGGTHTAADIKRQYEAQRGKCYYCGVKVGKEYHADHAIPLSRGGSNGPENIVIACPSCNTSKAGRLPSEWPKGGRLL